MIAMFLKKRFSLLSSVFLVSFFSAAVNTAYAEDDATLGSNDFNGLTPIHSSTPIPISNELPGSGGLTPQIVGGEQAVRGEHPWMVQLVIRTSRGTFTCGGSLISSEWVLSAAHCFTPGSTVTAVAGVIDLRQAANRNNFSAENVFVHPSYRDVSTGFDIALIKLNRAVPSSMVNRFAQLPSVSLNNSEVSTGDTLKTMGWGRIREGGPTPDILRQVSVPVVSEAACERTYGSINNSTQVCAGFTRGGRDSCQGDSGGPLLFSRSGEDYVAGIVSYGNGCARPNAPGVYTRTSGFLDWIDSIVDTASGGGTGAGAEGGGSVDNLSASANTWTQTYRIDVPAGMSTLDVDMRGSNGDADLYVYYNQTPTSTVNAAVNTATRCVPWLTGSNESCEFSNPRAGQWFIRVRAFEAFSGLDLQVRYAP